MAKASERQKQKKREKQRRKRQQAKEQARAKAQAQALPTSERGLVKLASAGEFGPAWICEGWDTPAWADRPVMITITRRLRGRLYLPHCVLVDRSCLGIKDAFTLEPTDMHELHARMLQLAQDGETMVLCEVPVAQSIVFHALHFAEGLEFEPHRDFHPSMFEPWPAKPLETAGARPERPRYTPEPDDEIGRVLLHLDRVVGPDNYDFMGRPRAAPRFKELEAEPEQAPEPPERPLHPADAGADPSRINWRLACTGVPWEPPLLPEREPIRDLRPTGEPEPRAPEYSWDVCEAIDTAIWEIEDGRHLVWEAAIRQQQQLPLSAEQSQALGKLVRFDDEAIQYINDLARPCEPWYQTFDRLLDRLFIERIDTERGDDIELLELGGRLLDAVEAHASPLSLPAGVASLAELLADARVSRVRAQLLFDPLFGLGHELDDSGRITLSDPEQADRVDEFIDGLRAAAPHLERLGWGLYELLEVVVLPAEEQRLLLEAIAARDPGLIPDMSQ